ncbi:class II aldolase/adducin family protein [Streptomyces sp. CA-249302]|uniref:class II aldolase/adducin family protein n=1 Tax=Streptomyces sp. CA-249302 TaxID=3240058 RepID=UPI003D9264CA
MRTLATDNRPPKTPFADIVTGCHVLGTDDHGDPVWGHVSARDPEGRGVWLKSGGRGFDEVSYEDIALVDHDGALVAGSGPPPREYPLHTEVLRARPDIDSVVHCHPPYSIALAATGQPLYAFSNGAGPFAGGVPRYEEPVGLVQTAELGAAVADRLGDARALFLVGHGIIAVGSTVATAVTTAILLERACRLQILAASAGGITPELRNPGKRYVHAESDGYLLRTWDYLVRRLDAAG